MTHTPGTIIADYPAYTIIAADPAKEWQDREVFAIAYDTRHHGRLWNFYTLGCVEDYSKSYGEDPAAAVENAKAKGHKLYWANANGASLTAWKRAKETRVGFEYGDAIRFKGKSFRLERAPNNNVNLIEIEEAG